MPASIVNQDRWAERGNRPVRVANCSGYRGDPGHHMYLQASLGDVDLITGDYLAEMNLAQDAEAYAAGKDNGFVKTAWEGLVQSLNIIAEKRIKVIINGGALNPEGLAKKTCSLIRERGLNLTVAYVEGDNVFPKISSSMTGPQKALPEHLDSSNEKVILPRQTLSFAYNENKPVVSANAYTGARAIVKGLQLGADIIICGRVSDASTVIGAAWYWFSWTDTDYNNLAGSLISGHLIECSAYVTGGNFSGFTEYSQDHFIHPGFPIAEIRSDGSCVITKHEGTSGMVNEDTVRCQLLYELQGDVYLNSDVKAYLHDIVVRSVGKDRVEVRGVVGRAPPPTTKLAIFYRGGYQSQILLNATGYATDEKWSLFERQLRLELADRKVLDKLDMLDFQIVGVPEPNPRSQLRSTTYCRVFSEAENQETILAVASSLQDLGLRHFSGFHGALDMRTALPIPVLGYYPALWPQDKLDETVSLLTSEGELELRTETGHPSRYEGMEQRKDYATKSPKNMTDFGPTSPARLGDIALARSGDKGANINFGIFVRTAKQWEWLRAFMSHEMMKILAGENWRPEYHLERVEFPNVFAVHFVIYGILERGVSSTSRLDCLGKGFADYIRDKVVDVPRSILPGNQPRV